MRESKAQKHRRTHIPDLLEKSRVIRQAPGERCYHIFYQIFTNAELKKSLQLDQDLKFYHFVSQAELTIAGVDDTEEFQMTDEAFDILLFTPDEKANIYKICAGMMHMGEMKFKQKPRDEQAEPDDGNGEAVKACAVFGIETEAFLTALTRPRVKVGNEYVNKGQNVEQVHWTIGAMTKGVYNRVFNFLVEKCNMTLDAKELPRHSFCGVLDIAGFEIFDFNSFEQLWINFVNEKLQQFFNHHMFVLEQEEYKKEGINWVFIDFGLDLAACIELIEKPMGVISMLDEECVVPKGTDLTLAQKLCDQYLGKHPNFQKPKPPKGKQAEAHFALGHYAGIVRYNVTAWLEKNKDPLNDSAVAAMKASTSNKLLVHVWGDYQTAEEQAKAAKEGGGGKKKGKSASMMTVSMLYRESLNKLMAMLHTTHPHFIRCLIPNEQKKSGMLEATLVLNQLTCNGVLEGIRICRKGFPNRTQHPEFVARYSILAADAAKASEDKMKCSDGIMKVLVKQGSIEEDNFRIGKTKVFFKAGILALMEDLRDEKLSAIILGFQTMIRWYKQKKVLYMKRLGDRAWGILQKGCRRFISMHVWDWWQCFLMLRPHLKCGKEEEEMQRLQKEMKAMEVAIVEEEAARKTAEEEQARIIEEKNRLFAILQDARSGGSDFQSKQEQMMAQKTSLEKHKTELEGRIAAIEDKNRDVERQVAKAASEADSLGRRLEELDKAIGQAEAEKGGKEDVIRGMQEEMARQDELIARLNREKKSTDEMNRKMGDELGGEEDREVHLNRLKGRLESKLDELEDQLEREKKQRQDLEKGKRKAEGELKTQLETIEEATNRKQELETALKRKEGEVLDTLGRVEEESAAVAKQRKQMKQKDALRAELEEEVDMERTARAKAERARSELQREMEELMERLEEAGGSTTAQMEMNKRREAELAKLRRDLDEVELSFEALVWAGLY